MILILPKWPPWISIRVPFSAKLRPKTEDFSKPNLPIRKKFGSHLGNVMLEANTNFGENRFSKLHEIMVWSGWYQFPGGQTCIQNLPGPKQRFLVISQNWCGDFPPNLVITLNLLSSPQIQIFIEMWSISAKKSIDSLLGLWASKISDSYSASTALFGDFSKLVRRFSTKFGDHVKIALFTTNPNFYWNSSVISEEIHWSTFLDSGEQWICPKSLIIRIFDER